MGILDWLKGEKKKVEIEKEKENHSGAKTDD